MNFPQMPAYQPYDLQDLAGTALKYDQLAYGYSDTDFKARHPRLLKAEHLFERGVLKDQQGESTLMPQIQNEYMRAGLSNALGAFGTTSPVLTPGSAGEATVARNLGNSIMSFQDRNRANRMSSLQLAESLFPRRTFGLTGENATNIDMLNTQGMNSWNQANYANQVQQAQYNQQLQAQQAAAGAGQTGALVQGAGSLISGIVGALAMACWCARTILGDDDIRWVWFREFVLFDSPKWFSRAYLKNGKKWADWLKLHPRVCKLLKPLVIFVALAKKACSDEAEELYVWKHFTGFQNEPLG